jgi:hypothetical protein
MQFFVILRQLILYSYSEQVQVTTWFYWQMYQDRHLKIRAGN